MGGKSSTSTSTVKIPPEVLARYNAVNARAEQVAKTPFQAYSGQFVAPLSSTQQQGIQDTRAAAGAAQPYYNAATGLTMAGTQAVGPLTQEQIAYYQNPYTQAVVDPTLQALQQQQGQERSQQRAQAIRAGAFGGDRAGLERANLARQQELGTAQAISPLYQQGYQQAVQTAAGQQGVAAADINRLMQGGQQLAGIGSAAQQAALQGAQAEIGAGTLEQQTKQADLTARYQQFLQERGYDFQVAQFLANIAMGTGALSGSTTTTTQPQGLFSDRRLKENVKKVGKTNDGLPIYTYNYKGDDKTQMGLMAQDVEKKKPEAVGLAAGFKTVDYDKATEGSHRRHRDLGGNVMDDYDPNSMGGAVDLGSAGEAFARGGYAGGGLIDSDDLKSILAAQQQAFGPFSQAGLYGGAHGQDNPMGGKSYVPKAGLATPKLVTPSAMPKAPQSGLAQAVQGINQAKGLGETADSLASGAKRVAVGSAPVMKDGKVVDKGSMGLWGNEGKTGGGLFNAKPADGVAAAAPAKVADAATSTDGPGFFDRVPDFVKGFIPSFADGGSVDPHHRLGYAGLGKVINPMELQDPSEGIGGYIDDATESQSDNKLNAPGGGGVGSGGKSGVGGDLMQIAGAIGAAKTLGSAATSAASAIPEWLAIAGAPFGFERGGVVPRQGYEDGGTPSFEDALKRTLAFEGGYADDTGGPTMMGISSKANPDVDLDRVAKDPEYKADIYRKRYWEPIGAEGMSAKMAPIAFDTAVNLGVGKTKQLLESAGDDPAKLLELRKQHYADLIARDPEKYGQYEKGWSNRVNDLMSYAGAPQAEGLGAIERATKSVKDTASEGLGGVEKFAKSVLPTKRDTDTGEEGINWKQIIIPALTGLGAAATTPTRNLGTALAAGLGAGAQSYAGLEKQQADVDRTKAETFSVLQAASKNYISSDGNAVQLRDGTWLPIGEWYKLYKKTGTPPATMGGDVTAQAAAALGRRLEGVPAKTDVKTTTDTGVAKTDTGATGTASTAGTAKVADNAGATGATGAPGAPKVEYSTARPSLLGSSSQDLSDREGEKLFSPAKEQHLASSATYAKTSQAMADAARANTINANQMALAVSGHINGRGLAAPGTAFPARQALIEFGNTVGRATGGEELSKAPTYANMMDKASTISAQQAAQGAGFEAQGSLAMLKNANPNVKMTPDAMAELAAQALVYNRMAKEREDHRIEYASRSGTGTNINAGTGFTKDTADRFNQNTSLLKHTIMYYPREMAAMVNQQAKPEVIEKFFYDVAKKNKLQYTPGMSGYFMEAK